MSDDYLKQEEEKDIRKVTHASRVEQFSKWSTPALYMWACHHPFWPLRKEEDKRNRKAILKELSKPQYSIPASILQLRRLWDKFRDPREKKEPEWYHHAEEEENEEGEEEDAEQQEGQVDEEEDDKSQPGEPDQISEDESSEPEDEGKEGKDRSKKKSKSDHVPLRSTDPPSTAEGPSASQKNKKSNSKKQAAAIDPEECPHCGAPSNSKFCLTCGMRNDLPHTDELNVFLRQRTQAKNISLQGSNNNLTGNLHRTDNTQPSSVTTKSTLTKHEQEYERLTAEGSEYGRFKEGPASPYKVADAYTQISKSYQGSELIMPPSSSLIKFIQSGKVKYPAWLVPKRVMEEETSKSGDTFFKVSNDGRVTTSQLLLPKPLTDTDQLVEVLLCSIIPALIDKPHVLMDWVSLTRSTLEVARTHSWTVAQKYLNQTLASKINTRSPFGDFDYTILASVVAAAGRLRPQDANKSSALDNNKRQGTDSANGVCGNFNFFKEGCKRRDCKFQHRCLFFEKCGITDPKHRGRDCEHNPRRNPSDSESRSAAADPTKVKPERK
jgi:hypothetical protein